MRNLVKALLVVAVAVPAIASAAITNSKHDLASGSTTTGPKADTVANGGSDQTCIFCHAPHRALQQSLIWNHTAAATGGGWAAGTKTQAGTNLPTALGSQSQVCLTCHDGTVALGDVNSGAIKIATNAAVDASGKLLASSGYQVGPTMGAAGAANHPVSIPYAGQTYNGVTSTATGYYTVQAGVACTSPSGVCTTETTNGAKIQLFGASGSAGIECGSCHDVHNGTTYSFFLRVDQAQSAICKACHNK